MSISLLRRAAQTGFEPGLLRPGKRSHRGPAVKAQGPLARRVVLLSNPLGFAAATGIEPGQDVRQRYCGWRRRPLTRT
jgi:hypothetical protein